MKTVIRFLFFIAVVYLSIASLIGLIKVEEIAKVDCQDQFTVLNSNDRSHQRSWRLYDYTSSFCTTYESYQDMSKHIGEKRNKIIIDASEYEDIWGNVYRKLVNDSKSYIGFIVDSLTSVSKRQNLSSKSLAEMVVTFVQDIPYSYVRPEKCSDSNNKGKPCVGNIALGILSPYEFLHSLYGDCDTRAVLIYTILEEMGFDPMIVVSNQYAHAMLALNISSTGDHLKYKGRNYYFWETTAEGWPIGMLPPNTNNINYWKIALVNER
ncbi:MAG: hypothetical protein AAFY41_01105 [Bacteroidota bacterium]